jgi:nitrogen fixation/metabolism regulation signal transduction histidine kinase
LALDGEPFVIATDKVGSLPYQVISVPLRLTPTESAILSMPMLPREREARAVLTEVEQGMRLALLLFLAAAGVLAHSMARRISQPIAALTAAAARISEGDLATRVETASRDELRGLVEAFNRMAGDLDRQRLELERTHRLAAWTDMARQVAHEVKNPLTPIQLSAEHLRRVYGDPSVDFASTLETCTQAILKQVRTLRGIVSEFSAFARPPEVQRDPLDVAALVAETLRPYQAALPPGISIDLEVAPVPAVRGDRRMLERVVVNLVENALQAVGEAGKVIVAVTPTDGGRGVRIAVADSGPGIDAETQRQIFRRFFSTKEGGSGLGLALVRKIARDHGGDIQIESQPGKGTRALVELPGVATETSQP